MCGKTIQNLGICIEVETFECNQYFDVSIFTINGVRMHICPLRNYQYKTFICEFYAVVVWVTFGFIRVGVAKNFIIIFQNCVCNCNICVYIVAGPSRVRNRFIFILLLSFFKQIRNFTSILINHPISTERKGVVS